MLIVGIASMQTGGSGTWVGYPGYTAQSSVSALWATGPSAPVEIPVKVDTKPVSPSVAFSYTITTGDPDTFSYFDNGTTKTKELPDYVGGWVVHENWPCSSSFSGMGADGKYSYVLASNGVLVPPKPDGTVMPMEIPAMTYINKYEFDDIALQGKPLILNDDFVAVVVTLTRAKYTIYIASTPVTPPGGGCN
ncbi:MAG: hypothetical protein NTX57_20795 [Armatimonadetes bacterium]|nr:hypothetical protein [Armatimonadota bacterium]